MYLTKLDKVSVRATGFVASVEKPINDDVLVDEITVVDPALYSGPQKRTVYFQRGRALGWLADAMRRGANIETDLAVLHRAFEPA